MSLLLDSILNKKYEFRLSEGELLKENISDYASISIDRYTSSNRRVSASNLTVAEGYHVLRINIQGTMILRAADSKGCRIVPPFSAMLISGPTTISTQMARGQHLSYLFSWNNENANGLGRWIAENSKANAKYPPVNSLPKLDPYVVDCFESITRTAAKRAPIDEVMALAMSHAMVGQLMTVPEAIILATVPRTVPKSIVELVGHVRQNPTRSWALNDAAEVAGYSPFHLSRTFKMLVGFGFPEYVDRCRTEVAVTRLSATDDSIDDVALACGFRSTHGLRASIKEYLGLLPSEIRPQQ